MHIQSPYSLVSVVSQMCLFYKNHTHKHEPSIMHGLASQSELLVQSC